ncbi:MAG: nuclear transport factor 2 family protein [Minwuia sp.]|nr:nuclear transport factor 2 family protein [Minwuia sp.]
MPDRARLESFIAMVESGDHVRAIADFYHPEATMQENAHPLRAGREKLMAFEQRALDAMSAMVTHPARVAVHDGDNVAIHWTFDQTLKDGRHRTIDEVALQVWQGDRIMTERFFYDSAAAAWKDPAA